MQYFSTNNIELKESFRKAVLNGLSPDGGLYMPHFIPQLDDIIIQDIDRFTFQELGYEIAKLFVNDEIDKHSLRNIINESISFKAPLVSLDNNRFIMELFHGPTLAFKDFGARFMARTMGHFIQDSEEVINILVATSGDTGSAVASGFYGVDGINVFLLYPSGKVSDLQEMQLTTYDKNIIALEIDGTFDDCQRLVKEAFVDDEIKSNIKLSSANSINIARLIPQSFYYFNAYKQLKDRNRKLYFSVPSGNLGNLTGGLFAKKMGLPVEMFIAATNSNSVFTEFVETGNYIPRSSVKTFSNAMDVGAPSNLARIQSMYDDHSNVIEEISSNSHNDQKTITKIRETHKKYNYILDPHGAVGLLAIDQFIDEEILENYNAIILETAHPAKFKDIVDDALKTKIELPEELRSCLQKEKKTVRLSSSLKELKSFLIDK